MGIQAHPAGDNRRPAASAAGPGVERCAFTLIELLVTTGIISLLIAITLPVLGHIRDASKRVAELSNLRQLHLACMTYSLNGNGFFPPGRVPSAPSGSDDYTWLAYPSWSQMTGLVPGLDAINSCTSVREGFADADDFGSPATEYGSPDKTRVGWVYWAGRDDLLLNGQLQYRSMHKSGEHLTPGSQTLWTCLCWDSAGNGDVSVCPHVGTNCVTYPNGVALKPPPDGLNVGLDDGSASFVHWVDLITIQQANGYKLYYQP